MKLMRVGIDLAKSVFQVHGVDRHERVVWRRKLTRAHWLKVFLETVEPGCWHGGVRRCASLGARVTSAWLQRQVDRAAIREAVREEQQE